MGNATFAQITGSMSLNKILLVSTGQMGRIWCKALFIIQDTATYSVSSSKIACSERLKENWPF